MNYTIAILYIYTSYKGKIKNPHQIPANRNTKPLFSQKTNLAGYRLDNPVGRNS